MTFDGRGRSWRLDEEVRFKGLAAVDQWEGGGFSRIMLTGWSVDGGLSLEL